MKTRGEVQTTIAIIGGGVSGALTAYHLTEQGPEVRVVVIDPRPELGLGLAYSTPSLRHLLNVPAGKISALPEEPDHFLNWLRRNYDAGATEKTFAPRAVFGCYVQSLVAAVRGIEHVQAAAVEYRRVGERAVVVLDNGCELVADRVVVATGNFDPAPLPGVEEAAIASGAYRHNAWRDETYVGLDPDAEVTVIGTGLTAVDVVLRLREMGHRGTITAASRHGVFPNPHVEYAPMAESAIPLDTVPTCVAYLKALRGAIRAGAEWRAAIDSLRGTTNDLWLALPLKEQQRFRRHLQRRWDVVRHRMAPPIAAVIEGELAAGTLQIREGSLERVEVAGGGALVTIRNGHGSESFATARVINCTGPSMNYRRVNSPLLESLFAQGLVTSGPMGGGFNCTRDGALIGADGEASELLFNLGPGRLGTLLESIAIPEIREQAVALAGMLVAAGACVVAA
jgi:hydroxyacylglutathione hydrolase